MDDYDSYEGCSPKGDGEAVTSCPATVWHLLRADPFLARLNMGVLATEAICAKSETCPGTISRLSSCLYEEMHEARKSGTGQSLFAEHGCASSSNQAKRGLVLFVCRKKTGQGR